MFYLELSYIILSYFNRVLKKYYPPCFLKVNLDGFRGGGIRKFRRGCMVSMVGVVVCMVLEVGVWYYRYRGIGIFRRGYRI